MSLTLNSSDFLLSLSQHSSPPSLTAKTASKQTPSDLTHTTEERSSHTSFGLWSGIQIVGNFVYFIQRPSMCRNTPFSKQSVDQAQQTATATWSDSETNFQLWFCWRPHIAHSEPNLWLWSPSSLNLNPHFQHNQHVRKVKSGKRRTRPWDSATHQAVESKQTVGQRQKMWDRNSKDTTFQHHVRFDTAEQRTKSSSTTSH